MKKAFGQTVRDIKRGVNKKVLKVPSIEQKVLDATSNEPWGPHGSLLSDIAHATKNYHEYQIIMSVMWKRINDTGKNWRHVYKALTVLEYLVAHGSERVIDEIREHAYQISTLSDFQYIDSSGRDQGNNVRKKSQSLVVLVNDKERIQEFRQKAASNKDKYRNSSGGNMYRPGSFSSSTGYGDDDRSEGRNSYGRERDMKDDDRYGGRYGDSNEKYGSRDFDKEDDYQGRGRSADEYRYGSRSRSVDRDRERSYEEEDQYSSRGSGAKADDHSQSGSTNGRGLDRKNSEPNLGAPPSYEEAVDANRSPNYSDRDGESTLGFTPKAPSPPISTQNHSQTTAAVTQPHIPASSPEPALVQVTDPAGNTEIDGFDEFDPRNAFKATPTTTSNGTAPSATAGNGEMDFLGSLTDSFASNSLALVPANQPTITSDYDSPNFSSGPTFAAASQPFGDPFGDGPFQAIPTDSVQQTPNGQPQPVPQNLPNYPPSGPTNPQFTHQESTHSSQEIDILADILPPSTPLSFANTQTNFQPEFTPQLLERQSSLPGPQNNFQVQTGPTVAQTVYHPQSMALTFPIQTGHNTGQPVSQSGFPSQMGYPQPSQTGQPASIPGYPSQMGSSQAQFGGQYPQLSQTGQPGFPPQTGSSQAQFGGQYAQPSQTGQPGFLPQMGSSQGQFGGQYVQPSQTGQPGFPPQIGGQYGQPSQTGQPGFSPQMGSSQGGGQYAQPSQTGQPISLPGFPPQMGSSQGGAQANSGGQYGQPSQTGQPVLPLSTGSSSAIVPQPPSNDKFETKSSVWADTLSRGLVNLNISGPKTNPNSDIGVDFDAMNRKEKRFEKPTIASVASTINMGKAMGSGTGMGRAGASALRPPQNPLVNQGMNNGMHGGAGMGMGMGNGMGMGGYGVNQSSMGRGMGMGMGMGMNMHGNMGMGPPGQGVQMPMGFPPGSNMPGGYNNPMGTGNNYGQQPYGRGY